MSTEIVHEGWLVKSPPPKSIFRGRWRRRWFVLRHTGELPGQYFLCYYADRNCRKLKGQIDLDECEQVDTGLQFQNNKQKYQHMFDVKTPKRVYYLAADSEDDMNKWVNCVCQVCGLKAYTAEDEMYNYGPAAEEPSTPTTETAEVESESPPVSPTSTTSAYIPISECITGPPLPNSCVLTDLELLTAPTASWRASTFVQKQLVPVSKPNTSANVSHSSGHKLSDEFYDLPRQLRPPPPSALDLHSFNLSQGDWDAQKSPGSAESVFTDEEWTGPGGATGKSRPIVNWETFPSSEGEQGPTTRPSDSDVDTSADTSTWNVTNRFNRLAVLESKIAPVTSSAPPPPRPPKPLHLSLDPPGHNYLNIESMSPALSNPPLSADVSETSVSSRPKLGSETESEPPSPLTTSTPLDGPAGVPGSSDDVYDFPRSHQMAEGSGTSSDVTRPPPNARHCYTNAAPGKVNGEIFRYDFHHDGYSNTMPSTQDEEPTSPRSESSQYSNLPSPIVQPSPPAVNRGLKPKRKVSDSAGSNEASPSGQPGIGPPSVDRNLKPRKGVDSSKCNLDIRSRSLRKTRTGPSPTPPQPPGSAPSTLRNGFRMRSDHCSSSDDDHHHSPDDEQFYGQYYGSDSRFVSSGKEIKYLDLDLEKDKDGHICSSSLMSVVSGLGVHPAPKSPEKGPPTATVYKTVDFLKTEAFNRTRQRVEEERKQCV